MKRLLVALALIVPYQAHAVLISTSIGDFDVTSLNTTFLADEALYRSQVWWGNAALAEEFATLAAAAGLEPAVGGSVEFGHALGCRGPVEIPCDLDNLDPNLSPVVFTYGFSAGATTVTSGQWLFSDRECCAVATRVASVSEPGTLGAFGAGLLALGIWRRRSVG